MEKNVTITTFTDPMMGLSYECEPIFRKLETHFGSSASFQNRMGVLVQDVRDFMIPSDEGGTLEETMQNYNARLARIYESEESIGGMPIHMDSACFRPCTPPHAHFAWRIKQCSWWLQHWLMVSCTDCGMQPL